MRIAILVIYVIKYENLKNKILTDDITELLDSDVYIVLNDERIRCY